MDNYAPFDLQAPADNVLDSSLFTVQDVTGETDAYASAVKHEPAKNCGNLQTTVNSEVMPNQSFTVHNQASLVDDNCLQTERNNQNVEHSDYMLTNFRTCDANLVNILNIATENKGITVKDGYDVNSNKIDDNSNVRYGDVESRPKCSQQLFTRPYKTVPFMGRGVVDNAKENEIRTGNATFKDRHVSKKENQERTMDNHFVPLTKNLQDNVQNPMNLVEEANCDVWVRGGIPSRQIVKDLDYYYRSKDSEQYKDYIMGKKAYARAAIDCKDIKCVDNN
jgi:hypothetical protein